MPRYRFKSLESLRPFRKLTANMEGSIPWRWSSFHLWVGRWASSCYPSKSANFACLALFSFKSAQCWRFLCICQKSGYFHTTRCLPWTGARLLFQGKTRAIRPWSLACEARTSQGSCSKTCGLFSRNWAGISWSWSLRLLHRGRKTSRHPWPAHTIQWGCPEARKFQSCAYSESVAAVLPISAALAF